MVLGYERIGNLVAVSAVKRAGVLHDLEIEPSEITVKFSEYVKSQIHLNLVDDLFGRSLKCYIDALRFLRMGHSCYRKEACEVLRYFYTDMSNFLIHNPSNIKLSIEVDTKMFNLSSVCYDIREVKNELNAVLDAHDTSVIRSFKYTRILKLIDTRDEIVDKPDSCAIAAVLAEEANSEELHKIILKGGFG